MRVPSFGPLSADILIVGEAPSKDDYDQREPLVGSAGLELSRMLHEAGIIRTECRVTYACHERPPADDYSNWFSNKKTWKGPNATILQGVKELEEEIIACQPKVIIALGKLALWALTGEMAISNWRGSIVNSKPLPDGKSYKVVPIYHPSYINKLWKDRYITVSDLKRARKLANGEIKAPHYNFLIRPSFYTAMCTLNRLYERVQKGPTRVAVDIETRLGHIDCIGFAWSETDAICIPHMNFDDPEGYWTLEEELEIIWMYRKLMTHPNFQGIGQNWSYDAQYIARHWGFKMNLFFDTMIGHHTAFPGLEKSLDFLCSMYLDWYEYWKQERKSTIEDEQWVYNCKDCCGTFAVVDSIQSAIKMMDVEEPFKFQMSLFNPVLNMVLRGVKIDKHERAKFAMLLLDELVYREQWFKDALGHPLNPRSPKQMSSLFYEDFRIKKVFKRGAKGPTCDDNALKVIGDREVLLRPLCTKIKEYRTIGIFNSNFVQAGLDWDGRIRCQFKLTGTETFRFASSEDAFGFGTNLQNVPKEKDTKRPDKYKAANKDEEFLELPNIRKLFIPDPGFVILDCDLPQADAQIVAWEAGDETLKAIFRDPDLDLHIENTRTIFGSCEGKKDPNRPKAKAGVHATNYGASAWALARALGITVREAERFQNTWFAAHPEIREWHERVQMDLQLRRTVTNPYGYKRFYFDRLDQLLPQALAWVPQSAVAIAINKILVALNRHLGDKVHLLMQVHDSLVFQVREEELKTVLPKLIPLLRVEIPYEDPLVLQAGLDISDRSWGEVEDITKSRWAKYI